jgi:phosphoribosylformimino-5-aminoimidazole carboxamide ribonucleotide (ProFAR) isomerase
VTTVEQIKALAAIANVESAVVGRALYDGSLTLEAAVEAAVAGKPNRQIAYPTS